MDLPRYKCHKEVRAAKIVSVDAAAGHMQLEIDGQVSGMSIRHEWFEKHTPAPGGYLVQYEGGYLSFSPAKAFEDGYTRIDG